MRARAVAGCVAAVVIGLASCSSGGSTTEAAAATSTTAPAPSTAARGTSSSAASPSTAAPEARAAYVHRADAICRAAQEQVSVALPKDPAAAGDLTGLVDQQLVPTMRSMLHDLRALTPPPGDAAAVGHVFDLMDQALAQVQQNPQLLLGQGGGVFSSVADAAARYGFEVCGRS